MAAAPVQAALRIQVKKQRQVGAQAARGKARDIGQGFQVETAPVTLVGQRAIGKPVAEHNLALRQSRADHFGDVLRPRRRIEQDFGHRRHRRIGHVVQAGANLIADVGAARLARA